MSSFREPIVILSDMHLCALTNWRAELGRLRGLWKDAGTVIFNGDTMNWGLAHYHENRNDVVEHILALCEEDGTQPVLVGGNTDYQLEGARHLFLEHGRILVMHGDAMFENSSPWRKNAAELAAARKDALLEISPGMRETLEGQVQAAVEALRAVDEQNDNPRHTDPVLARKIASLGDWVLRPRRIAAVLRAWWKLPAIASGFMEKYAPGADFLVFGHAHRRGIWEIEERTVINTGSFEKPARPLMVKIGDGKIIIFKVRGKKSGYSPGDIVGSFLF